MTEIPDTGLTEQEKCSLGLLYDTAFPGREEAHIACARLCSAYNSTPPGDMAAREAILRRLFGKLGRNPYVEPDLFCGFGTNIEAGDNFYVNNSCVFVDPGKICFGNNVLIGPQCGFYTALHPLDAESRNAGLESAQPITVGDNVWFGGGVKVLPGVHIGSNTVIGAGSVVTRDIPSDVLAFGNPCRVVRSLKEDQPNHLPYGKRVWILPEASAGLTAVNTGDADAHIRVTLMYDHRAPVEGLSITVGGRRTRELRPLLAEQTLPCTVLLESDVPIAVSTGENYSE